VTIDLRETRLPGIGIRYSFVTADGTSVAVIQHNDGLREVYVRGRRDDEPTTFRLHDDEARQVGALLGGAYERPRIVEDLELALGELQIEWIRVPDDSPAIGKTLAECAFRSLANITVIAILREPEPITGAQPSDRIERGDTLVTVGKAGSYPEFRRLLTTA
jgi:TrkA domain protein